MEKVNDIYIQFLEEYYKRNKTINDIKRDMIIEYKGQTLKVGEFYAQIRKQHRLYEQGKNSRGCQTPLSISRYEALEKMGFTWNPGEEKATRRK